MNPWKRRFLLETIIFRCELLVLGRVVFREFPTYPHPPRGGSKQPWRGGSLNANPKTPTPIWHWKEGPGDLPSILVLGNLYLVGGWTNPFEKYDRQNWIISPGFGVKRKTCLKPPPQFIFIKERFKKNKSHLHLISAPDIHKWFNKLLGSDTILGQGWSQV